jgi:hypothetical protein
MFALDYEGVCEREVSMKENPLVGVEFENKIDDLALLIDIEHGEYKMLEVAKFQPSDIAIIKSASRGSCHAFVFSPDAAVTVVGKSLAALQNY